MTSTKSQPAVWQAPEVPSKYDIIPIHNSDRAAFKRCRRFWDWSSPARNNFTVRADIHGVNKPMWFGTGCHWALEQYYNPLIKKDPVESFKTWFDIQWRGGVVTEYWLDRIYDLNPKPHMLETDSDSEGTVLFKVRGLEDILPDPITDEFDELRELGIGMMTFYKDYAAKTDDFEVLIAEHDFSVPIWDYEKQQVLKRVDIREESPNCGKELEVHARGRQDIIYRNIATNGLGIIDHKTASKIEENYFDKLETDEQCTTYLWAAQIEAQYYNLPHKGEPLEEIIYNTLRKAYPRPPTELKNGMFSVDRTKESCTYEILMDWIKRNLPGVPMNEKNQGYIDWLRDVGDEQFIIRKRVRRNQNQLKQAGYRIYLEALDMLDPNVRIYPNLTNDYSCINCAFRMPCIAQEDGSDYKQLIADNYTINKDR